MGMTKIYMTEDIWLWIVLVIDFQLARELS